MMLLYFEIGLALLCSVSFACENVQCDNTGDNELYSYPETSDINCMDRCDTYAGCVGYYRSRRRNVCYLYGSYSSSPHRRSLRACVPEVWSAWADGGCSVTCEKGIRTWTQYCCGTTCSQSSITQTESCDTKINCPVDGVWGDWSNFDQCSTNCGPGVQTRTRKCDKPKPDHGGLQCPGPDSETQECNKGPCAVDGNWGKWTSYGQCSVTCGGGESIRTRLCDNPAPQGKGADCAAPQNETMSCNTNDCPIDGIWGAWKAFGACSVTCGGGVQERSRSCDSPAPANNGTDCIGPQNETHSCNDNGCPVDGNWSGWSQFGPCSVSCGGGVKERWRECDSPAPLNGGADCVGVQNETLSCNTTACPNKPECRCTCTIEQNVTVEEMIDRRKRELQVNVTELSSTKRRLSCAEDNRTSATRVGLIGASMLIILGAFCSLVDVLSVVKYMMERRQRKYEDKK